MNQADYDRWWPLHLSVVRSEPLSEANRQFYLGGLRELQQSEIDADFAALESARRTISDLERQQSSLRSRRDELESEITALESALSQRTRQVLGVKE